MKIQGKTILRLSEGVKTMYFLKKQVSESYIIGFFVVLFKNILSLFMDSFVFKNGVKIVEWYNNVVLESKIVKLFFNTTFISEIWYKSYFYRRIMYRIRKISVYIPKAGIAFSGTFVGIFFSLILLIPDNLWSGMLLISLFLILSLLYISRNIRHRRGTVFVFINVILIMFILFTKIALPSSLSSTLIYLIVGIDFFFLVSFSIENFDDLKDVLEVLCITAIALCGSAYIQNIITSEAANVTFYDGVKLGEILVIVFPFVFAYSNEFHTGSRKLVYMAIIFIIFLNAITVTQSKAAFIGFLIEVLIFIITYPKYLPFVILLMPLGLNTIIDNFRKMWEATTSYGNIVNNIIVLFRRFWNTGFGVNSKKIIEMYNLKNIESIETNVSGIIPHYEFNGIYINFILEIGVFLIIVFMFYILKLAHSSLTRLFTAEKKYRRFFAAGLAMLIGISVSSFFETTIFSPRTMLIYWGMLGVLRAVRTMSFGVYLL